MLLNTLKSLLQEPPPAMAFEISESGIAVARIGSRTELDFRPLKPGTLAVSPLKDNVLDSDDFNSAVKALAAGQGSRKRREAALILPDYSTRIAVLDFDAFPSDPKEQLSLIRFRLKRHVPFDVDSAAVSYHAQPGSGKKVDVVAAVAPLEIVARYEAPFRLAGLQPGLVTPSLLAALDLAPQNGLTVVAKISGHALSVVVRDRSSLKLVRCLEAPSTGLDDILAILVPTFVYVEDNLGGRAEKLLLCGFGAQTETAVRRFEEELGVSAEPLRSPLGIPGENNAGLLGYLRSIAKNN